MAPEPFCIKKTTSSVPVVMIEPYFASTTEIIIFFSASLRSSAPPSAILTRSSYSVPWSVRGRHRINMRWRSASLFQTAPDCGSGWYPMCKMPSSISQMSIIAGAWMLPGFKRLCFEERASRQAGQVCQWAGPILAAGRTGWNLWRALPNFWSKFSTDMKI